MLVDVETESENWNFLKYGRIGKHPMQSLYTRYYLPCDATPILLTVINCAVPSLSLSVTKVFLRTFVIHKKINIELI